jgi:hypothetical protein
VTTLVDNSTLERWRSLDASTVLLALADHAKVDATYVPATSSKSTRWHVNCAGHDFELLLTGAKFWDTRSHVGGGGAIDLAIHLNGCSFKEATKLLLRSRL